MGNVEAEECKKQEMSRKRGESKELRGTGGEKHGGWNGRGSREKRACTMLWDRGVGGAGDGKACII